MEAQTPAPNGPGRHELIGKSPAFRQFQALVRKVAPTELAVLIAGETGVGKGLAARTLHELSGRCEGPFVQVNCGALPETLLDSELFGHERGAFTSAVSLRLGKVEMAKGGTLFLDEIGDMKLETQARMLRFLEERTFERIGGSKTLEVETRIVAATNRHLEELVRAGDFREDLYYRFQAFPIRMSPLRERREDIPLLAEFFRNRMAADLGKRVDPLGPEIVEALQIYPWPGNVQELVHTVQRAVIVCEGPRIQAGDLGLPRQEAAAGVGAAPLETELAPASPDGDSAPRQEGGFVPLDEWIRRYILKVLRATKGLVKGPGGAAEVLGLPSSTLYSRMKKLGIKDANSRRSKGPQPADPGQRSGG